MGRRAKLNVNKMTFMSGFMMLAIGVTLIVTLFGGPVNGRAGLPGEAGEVGPRGLPGEKESFSIAKIANTGVNDWTDTVDPMLCPGVTPGVLYRNMTSGTINYTDGSFTAGEDGVYVFNYVQRAQGVSGSVAARLFLNDVMPNFNDANGSLMTTRIMLNLVVGDVVQVKLVSGTFLATAGTEYAPCTYQIVFSMYRL